MGIGISRTRRTAHSFFLVPRCERLQSRMALENLGVSNQWFGRCFTFPLSPEEFFYVGHEVRNLSQQGIPCEIDPEICACSVSKCWAFLGPLEVHETNFHYCEPR